MWTVLLINWDLNSHVHTVLLVAQGVGLFCGYVLYSMCTIHWHSSSVQDSLIGVSLATTIKLYASWIDHKPSGHLFLGLAAAALCGLTDVTHLVLLPPPSSSTLSVIHLRMHKSKFKAIRLNCVWRIVLVLAKSHIILIVTLSMWRHCVPCGLIRI